MSRRIPKSWTSYIDRTEAAITVITYGYRERKRPDLTTVSVGDLSFRVLQFITTLEARQMGTSARF